MDFIFCNWKTLGVYSNSHWLVAWLLQYTDALNFEDWAACTVHTKMNYLHMGCLSTLCIHMLYCACIHQRCKHSLIHLWMIYIYIYTHTHTYISITVYEDPQRPSWAQACGQASELVLLGGPWAPQGPPPWAQQRWSIRSPWAQTRVEPCHLLAHQPLLQARGQGSLFSV